MKIMSYNILHGGIDANGCRIDHIIEVINRENPDFVALQEAHHFDKNDGELLKKVSMETGLAHYVLSPGTPEKDQRRAHVASFSHYSLQEPYLFPDDGLTYAGLSVLIETPIGQLSICNIHLHAHSEDENIRSGDVRMREARAVLDYQSKYDKYIVLGDFNSLSRADTHGDLTAHEFTHYDLGHFDATDLFNTSLVDAVVHSNLSDRCTHPTIGVPHRISKTPIRIDYIYLTSTLTGYIRDTRVIKSPTAEQASDHYPLVLTLD